MPATGRVQASDDELFDTSRSPVSALPRLAAFTVRDDIAAGRLMPVLSHLDTGDKEAFHAVYVSQDGLLPSRIKALLDFLAEKGKVLA